MSWRLEFRPEVADDIVHAAEWYESRMIGLGSSFVTEIEQTWATILKYPLIGSKRHPFLDIRWRLTDRFPYRVIYSISEVEQLILVVAVLHVARQESRWLTRVSE
jgi:plasmid stabilization system protein ParE